MYILDKDFRLIKTKIESLKPYRRLKILFYISVTINIILSVSLYMEMNKPSKIIMIYQRDTVVKFHDITLTDSTILKELIKNRCVLPNVALAQAKIESSHYTSKVCVHNKNLFGIKKHKCKYVTGQNLNHATYNTYRDNIKCYQHIQEHYLKNIDGNYAESSGYVELIEKMK
jgi:hypothetical protein